MKTMKRLLVGFLVALMLMMPLRVSAQWSDYPWAYYSGYYFSFGAGFWANSGFAYYCHWTYWSDGYGNYSYYNSCGGSSSYYDLLF